MKIDVTRDILEFFEFCAENVNYPQIIQDAPEDDKVVQSIHATREYYVTWIREKMEEMRKNEEITRLPDGSAFCTVSMPLPADHWSKVDPDKCNVPPMLWRTGTDSVQRKPMEDMIREAARYAYRSATCNGKCSDLDPDALIQNLIVGLLGYNTPTGWSSDERP